MPGDVHLDLLANKRIPDPFFRDNEAKLQWIEDASWEYELNFDVPAALLGRANVDLVFDGLDAAAEVYLNDAKVLDADNMFRVWRVPVKGTLHAGKNVLRVVFPSPIKAAEKVAATDPWRPKTRTAAKTYIRKAAYEYGWDWGPTFVTSGIWRPVRIEALGQGADCGFRDPAARCEQGSGASGCGSRGGGGERGSGECQRVQFNDAGQAGGADARKADLHAGRNVIDVPVEIRQPKLWFPAGYGDQPLYEFTADGEPGQRKGR